MKPSFFIGRDIIEGCSKNSKNRLSETPVRGVLQYALTNIALQRTFRTTSVIIINYTMRDRIYAYLKSQKAGAPSKELVEQVLNIKGASPHVSEKLIQTAVAGDRRFSVDKRHRWKIIEKGGTPLSEAGFVLLSLLTIDTPQKSRIIVEISAQKLRGDKIVDRLHTLVNPGASTVQTMLLPEDFAQEVKGGIPTEKAVRLFSDFVGDGILIGYDIHSSINQLNAVLIKSNEMIENPPLCLKFLAKKLIPDLQHKSINDIAAFFKFPAIDTRRTETEVCTAAEIFSRCRELLQEQEFSTVEEVLAFQYPDVDAVDFSKYAFDKGFLWAIPQRAGVYKMKNKSGDVIYVGKAKNLKVRVNSYFWNTADRLQKITDLLTHVYTIEYEETGSELAAIVLEFRLIQQYRPRLNQQLEVHERTTRYGNLKNFIAILPSSIEESLELFFVTDGLPLHRYEILRDAVNFSEIERILDTRYYEAVEANRCPPLHTKDNENLHDFPKHSHESPFSKRGLRGINVSSDGNIQNHNVLTDLEMGEMEIVMSWIEANKDQINYINMDTVSGKEACLKILGDYLRDEETFQKKHFRWL